MPRLDELKQTPIHSRQLDIRTFGCTENSIIVEGELKDDRLQPYYRLSGERCQPHAVHRMIIRLRVTGPDLRISDIETEFHQFPREECPQTADSLQQVKGWKIAPGFTQKAKAVLGGKAGCVHLTALFLSMAPAAVQGFWSYHARQPMKDPISPAIMERFLIDTCWVWRKDGPLAKETLRQLDKLQGDHTT